MDGRRQELAGSAPLHTDEAQHSDLPGDKQLAATILLRRRPDSPDLADQLLSGHFQPASPEAAQAATAADPNDLKAVESFARDFNLTVTESNPATRTVNVAGTVTDMNRAFGVHLASYGSNVSYSGPISLPESVSPIIVAVLGLDNRPVARPRTSLASA